MINCNQHREICVVSLIHWSLDELFLIFRKLWTSSLFLKIHWFERKTTISKNITIRYIFFWEEVNRIRNYVKSSNFSKDYDQRFDKVILREYLVPRLTFQRFCFSKMRIIPCQIPFHNKDPTWFLYRGSTRFFRTIRERILFAHLTQRREISRSYGKKEDANRRFNRCILPESTSPGNNCSRLKTITPPDCSFLAIWKLNEQW